MKILNIAIILVGGYILFYTDGCDRPRFFNDEPAATAPVPPTTTTARTYAPGELPPPFVPAAHTPTQQQTPQPQNMVKDNWKKAMDYWDKKTNKPFVPAQTFAPDGNNTGSIPGMRPANSSNTNVIQGNNLPPGTYQGNGMSVIIDQHGEARTTGNGTSAVNNTVIIK